MRSRRTQAIVLTCAVLLSGTSALLAEVSSSGWKRHTLVLATVVDDPNPIGIWGQYRPLPPDEVLNVGGDLRGDGPPDIAWTQDSRPVAVWSYNAGADGDIAYSEWDGATWMAIQFLTSGTADELDPRVVVEPDGTTHVVWWTDGVTEDVHLITRPGGTTSWNSPVLVANGARRPSVAVDAGALVVAYERDSVEPGMFQDIMAATDSGGGTFTAEIVASTSRADVLHPIVHARAGKTWVDWIHGAEDFGCAEKQASGWSGLVTEPWADTSWVGIEAMRRLIQGQVLQGD